MGSVGVAICNKYGLSKGKSLTKFVEEASPDDATKLLCDLLDYCEAHYFEEINAGFLWEARSKKSSAA